MEEVNINHQKSKRIIAPVNRVIPFSCVDGPGNRTAIFLQGCNFNCKYCHNPETIIMCTGCGTCVPLCPTGALQQVGSEVVYEREKCILCDTCIRNCPNGSSPRITWMSGTEVFREVEKQIPFIRGVTVSGGECTRHPDFLRELFTCCKKAGLGTLIDSNGSYTFENDPTLLSVTDGVMLDIKSFDKEEHKRVTGCSNEQVLQEAIFLAEIGKLDEVRTVIVPELFDGITSVYETAKMLAPYLRIKQIRYKLITYRKFGVREEFSELVPPSEEYVEKCKNICESFGFEKIILI